jgi:hypothetical protein
MSQQVFARLLGQRPGEIAGASSQREGARKVAVQDQRHLLVVVGRMSNALDFYRWYRRRCCGLQSGLWHAASLDGHRNSADGVRGGDDKIDLYVAPLKHSQIVNVEARICDETSYKIMVISILCITSANC